MLKQLGELATTDSLIFDIDGTLWDASTACAHAWNNALGKIGFDNQIITVEHVKSFSGVKIERILETFFHFIPETKHATLLKTYKEAETLEMQMRGGTLFPDVRNVLGSLKASKKLFIVSNCLDGYIENFLNYTKLHAYFDGYESSGNTGKPKSENIKKVIIEKRLHNPAYIGDTNHDYQACHLNQIPFVYAAYGFGCVVNPTYKIKKLLDLLEIIIS
jgi:phosphoglycolate phosphatase